MTKVYCDVRTCRNNSDGVCSLEEIHLDDYSTWAACKEAELTDEEQAKQLKQIQESRSRP